MENFRKFTESYEERERQRLASLEGSIPLWSSFGGKMLPIAQLMAEEFDRGNTTEEEFAGWLEKYGLTPESPATWVTTNPLYAAGYANDMRPPDVDDVIYDQGVEALESEDYFGEGTVERIKQNPTFTSQDGVLVAESHDGDDGYVFVRRDET